MSCRKRGQMEIIGLVVIVILIALGMLLMTQFALKSDAKKKIFVRKGLAYSAMSALMKTELECKGFDDFRNPEVKMLAVEKELIDDCAEVAHYKPPSYRECDGKDACDFLKEKIDYLLSETLGQWNKHYEFKSTLLVGDQSIELMSIRDNDEQGCSKERDSSGIFPLSAEKVGLVESFLYVCD